jgi:hypothetical protein
MMLEAKAARKVELISALDAQGLVFRLDSKLCEAYIKGSCADLKWVVSRMAWAKLTRQFCDWDHFWRIAYAERAPDIPLVVQAESLLTEWLPVDHTSKPWLQGFTVAQWRARYPVFTTSQ